MKTLLPETRLVTLRADGLAQRQRFIDPYVIARCGPLLDRRGEEWAASVLGRDISKRSLAVVSRPFLRGGEEYILLAADTEEDRWMLQAIGE